MVVIFWDFLLPSAKSFSQNENLVNTSKQLLKNRNCLYPAVHYFTLKLGFVLNFLFVILGIVKIFA